MISRAQLTASAAAVLTLASVSLLRAQDITNKDLLDGLANPLLRSGGGQILQAEVGRIFGVHALLHLCQHDTVAWRRPDPAATAAMSLKQTTEGPDQKFALPEDVPPLFDRHMHRQEGSDQIAIAEGVAREIGHGLDAEAGRHLMERLARQVH